MDAQTPTCTRVHTVWSAAAGQARSSQRSTLHLSSSHLKVFAPQSSRCVFSPLPSSPGRTPSRASYPLIISTCHPSYRLHLRLWPNPANPRPCPHLACTSRTSALRILRSRRSMFLDTSTSSSISGSLGEQSRQTDTETHAHSRPHRDREHHAVTQIRSHADTYTHTHTHTYARAHARTHTLARPPP